jgi:hypothetical protein
VSHAQALGGNPPQARHADALHAGEAGRPATSTARSSLSVVSRGWWLKSGTARRRSPRCSRALRACRRARRAGVRARRGGEEIGVIDPCLGHRAAGDQIVPLGLSGPRTCHV